jgi:kanamycin nucleotidyltransferase
MIEVMGLKPHTHADRTRIIESLTPLFQQKFDENLIAITADASYARGQDQAYSDLEMIVFLKQTPADGEDAYLQRIVDGMLVEIIYTTPEDYLEKNRTLSPDWHIAASDVLQPVYNTEFIEQFAQQLQDLHRGHPRRRFIEVAAEKFIHVQEAASKVLNAVEQNNAQAMGLLLFDTVLQLLIVHSLLNEKPYTTLARYIEQARTFPLKPEGFDALLDILVQGDYQDLPRVRKALLTVYRDMERIFAEQGFQLYHTSLDPNLPN